MEDLEADRALMGFGRIACLAYKGAREVGSPLDSLLAAAAVVMAVLKQPGEEEPE